MWLLICHQVIIAQLLCRSAGIIQQKYCFSSTDWLHCMSMNLFSIVGILWNMKYKVSWLLLPLCVPSREGLSIIVWVGTNILWPWEGQKPWYIFFHKDYPLGFQKGRVPAQPALPAKEIPWIELPFMATISLPAPGL